MLVASPLVQLCSDKIIKRIHSGIRVCYLSGLSTSPSALDTEMSSGVFKGQISHFPALAPCTAPSSRLAGERRSSQLSLKPM